MNEKRFIMNENLLVMNGKILGINEKLLKMNGKLLGMNEKQFQMNSIVLLPLHIPEDGETPPYAQM